MTPGEEGARAGRSERMYGDIHKLARELAPKIKKPFRKLLKAGYSEKVAHRMIREALSIMFD